MERISSVVYHFTTTDAAGGIIDSNLFRLQPIPVNVNVNPGKKYEEGFYMSVSRTKIEGYTKLLNSARCHFVRFELDGNKVGNRYKGSAFDYWSDYQGDNEYEEYEDRIFSKDMYIPNVLNYIKRMDLDVSRKTMSFETKKLITTATRAGVPTFIYSSREKWAQQSGGVEVKSLDDYKTFLQSITKQ